MAATTRTLTDYRLAAEALALLAVARVVLLCLRFPVAMRLAGLRPGRAAPVGPASDPLVSVVELAVRRAAARAPFRAVCLQQAVAAALMLRRRGRPVEVHFGVARDGARALTAHAWSVCGGQVVTGQAAIARHAPIAVFIA